MDELILEFCEKEGISPEAFAPKDKAAILEQKLLETERRLEQAEADKDYIAMMADIELPEHEEEGEDE